MAGNMRKAVHHMLDFSAIFCYSTRFASFPIGDEVCKIHRSRIVLHDDVSDLTGFIMNLRRSGTLSVDIWRRRDGYCPQVILCTLADTPADDRVSTLPFHRGGSWRTSTSADHFARSPPVFCREHQNPRHASGVLLLLFVFFWIV